jgi:hypothetical protein
MSLRVVFSPNAWEDYERWMREDVKIAKRIVRLIADVRRDPYGTGIGKPEILKGPLSGLLRAESTANIAWSIGCATTPWRLRPATATTSTNDPHRPVPLFLAMSFLRPAAR